MIDNDTDLSKREISFKELLFMIKAHRFTLTIAMVVSLSISIIYLIATNPIYTSKGLILIEDSSSSTMTSLFDMGIGSNANYLDNEIEILKSRTTSERAVKSLINSIHSEDLFLLRTKRYNVGYLPGKGLRGVVRKILFLDWDRQEIIDIKSTMTDSLFNILVEELRENLNISNRRNTDVLEIKFTSQDPSEAALLVNTIMDVYIKMDQEWASGEMSHLKRFLNNQLQIKKNELNEIEKDLQIFQEQEHIYGLDDNSQLLLNQLTEVEGKYHSYLATKNILIERKKYYSNQLSQNEKEYANDITNTLNMQLSGLRNELALLETEYLLTDLNDDHPAIVKLKNKIDGLEATIKEKTNIQIQQGISNANPIEYSQALMDSVTTLNALIEDYSAKLTETSKLVEIYEIQLSSLPSKYIKYSKLQRDKVILDETYALMKQKYEEARITEASQLGKVRIIDSANPETEPSSPNKKITLIFGILSGFLIGVTIIILKEYINSTIKSIEEIERRGLNVLCIIPAIDAGVEVGRNKKKGYKLNLKLNSSDKIERRLLTHEDPKSPIAEAYRSLRTSLMFNYDKNQTSKIILVSSSGPGEGKTTTVANLAITYANMGKKTLLVDGDLRKPVIHKMFKTDKRYGLTNFLSNKNNFEDITTNTEVENLDLVVSGLVPPNPSELLSSNEMNNFVKEASEKYDIILFDSPPLIAVTDAMVVKRYVDQFVLVVRASGTEKGALDRVLSNFKNSDEYVDGVVFNGVDESNSYGGGYYYNYYQYYYGEES